MEEIEEEPSRRSRLADRFSSLEEACKSLSRRTRELNSRRNSLDIFRNQLYRSECLLNNNPELIRKHNDRVDEYNGQMRAWNADRAALLQDRKQLERAIAEELLKLQGEDLLWARRATLLPDLPQLFDADAAGGGPPSPVKVDQGVNLTNGHGSRARWKRKNVKVDKGEDKPNGARWIWKPRVLFWIMSWF